MGQGKLVKSSMRNFLKKQAQFLKDETVRKITWIIKVIPYSALIRFSWITPLGANAWKGWQNPEGSHKTFANKTYKERNMDCLVYRILKQIKTLKIHSTNTVLYLCLQ